MTEETKTAYYYWLNSLWPCLFFRKKLYIMGGVQIPQKRFNKFLFNWILKHTEHLYCRDFDCVNNLKQYGFSKVSFFMDTSYFVREDRKKYKIPSKEKYLVINDLTSVNHGVIEV